MACVAAQKEERSWGSGVVWSLWGGFVCCCLLCFLAGAYWERSQGTQLWLQAHALVSSATGGAEHSIQPTAEWEQQCGGPLDVAHPIVGDGDTQLCLAFSKVCFDQQAVVVYDPAYSPANATSVVLPRLPVDEVEYAWAGSDQNGDRFHHSLFKFPPLTIRPASILEAGPDLQQPQFSNCTVPVVMWSNWAHNFEEFLSHTAARVWGLQHEGGMSNGSLLVIATPSGIEPRPFARFLLQPFSPHPIMTFAELSSRAQHPGHPGRCFQSAILCAFKDAGWFNGMFDTMQAVHSHYSSVLPAPEPQYDPGDDVFKVLIEHRSGPVRNLLNWEELVEQCNSLPAEEWGLPPDSPFKRVQCSATTFTDGEPKRNMANVRTADVLVIVHGSGCANWLSMRPGSALLEFRPYQFGADVRGWADWFYPQITGAIGYNVFWYAINVEDPAAHEPSERERRNIDPDPDRYKRDRHTRLPFAALRETLARVAAAGRDKARYLAQVEARMHYVELKPGGQLAPVPV